MLFVRGDEDKQGWTKVYANRTHTIHHYSVAHGLSDSLFRPVFRRVRARSCYPDEQVSPGFPEGVEPEAKDRVVSTLRAT